MTGSYQNRPKYNLLKNNNAYQSVFRCSVPEWSPYADGSVARTHIQNSCKNTRQNFALKQAWPYLFSVNYMKKKKIKKEWSN